MYQFENNYPRRRVIKFVPNSSLFRKYRFGSNFNNYRCSQRRERGSIWPLLSRFGVAIIIISVQTPKSKWSRSSYHPLNCSIWFFYSPTSTTDQKIRDEHDIGTDINFAILTLNSEISNFKVNKWKPNLSTDHYSCFHYIFFSFKLYTYKRSKISLISNAIFHILWKKTSHIPIENSMSPFPCQQINHLTRSFDK